ncbi:MAG TPA: ribose-phosphate diphosphokinase [Gemmatimonadaceae bacterium]
MMLHLPPVHPAILSLPDDRPLAAQLGTHVGCPVMPVASHVFPDGETSFRSSGPRLTEDAVIVASLRSPDRTTPLLLLSEAARQWGAKRVGLVAPYLPYMRQDIAFHEGEAITARSFARILSRSFDWMATVDPHLHRIKRLSEIFSIPTRALHAAALVGQWIARNVERPLVVGPDDESHQWAEDVATAASAPCVVLDKTRRGDRDVSIHVPPSVDAFREYTPVLIDDIVSTGTTMAATASRLLARGFAAPVCVAVHAVFAPGALDALEQAGARCVVSTNTIPHFTNHIDIIPLLASAVSRHSRRLAALG